MIEFIAKENKANLILFVHGFTGGKETWKNIEHGYFFDQLKSLEFINKNFDIA